MSPNIAARPANCRCFSLPVLSDSVFARLSDMGGRGRERLSDHAASMHLLSFRASALGSRVGLSCKGRSPEGASVQGNL